MIHIYMYVWKYQAGPWECEDPVESWETKGREKSQMDFVPKATHLPAMRIIHIDTLSLFNFATIQQNNLQTFKSANFVPANTTK